MSSAADLPPPAAPPYRVAVSGEASTASCRSAGSIGIHRAHALNSERTSLASRRFVKEPFEPGGEFGEPFVRSAEGLPSGGDIDSGGGVEPVEFAESVEHAKDSGFGFVDCLVVAAVAGLVGFGGVEREAGFVLFADVGSALFAVEWRFEGVEPFGPVESCLGDADVGGGGDGVPG